MACFEIDWIAKTISNIVQNLVHINCVNVAALLFCYKYASSAQASRTILFTL